MDEIDAQIQALRAEIAAANAAPDIGYTSLETGAKQGLFDIGAGIAGAGAGLVDVLSLPVVAAARGLGADPETTRYFALSKELQNLKETVAPKYGVAPDTDFQELVSFVTPSPLSKLKLLSQAGTGLVSYLGMKGAEVVAPESQYAGLVGALAGPGLATYAGKLAGAGIKSVSPAVGIAAGSDEALRAAAQAEVLRQAGTEGAERLRLAQEMPELATGTGGVPLTAAEIVQTPTLAQYQQEIGKKAGATDILGAARETRGVELQAALERLGVTPQAGDFALALQDVARQSAAAKAATETGLLSALGLEDIATKPTKMEVGTGLQKSLLQRADDVYEPVAKKWQEVDKATKMDVAPQLDDAVTTFNSFDKLTKKRMSGIAQDTIKEADWILNKRDGLITIKEYQSLRASANAAIKNATKGTDRAELNLMGALKQSLDNIDESAIVKGGAGEQVGKLREAITATKDYYQTFGRGVVSEIIKQKGGQLTLKASKVVDRALNAPENVADIIGKFGRESDEAIALRSELVDRLSKQANPTRYLGENKDLYQKAFDADYADLVKYAQKKGQGAPFSEFAKISDTQIPNKIFADVKQANAFMERFQGTELEQYARAKFITTKLTKSGNAVANLDANKKIAQRLFGADYNDLQKVLSDIELSKTPGELAKAASKGQSITSQSLTSLGAIAASRGVIGVMKQGALPSTIVGGFGGGWLGATAGLAAGAALRKTGQARELQMNKFVAEILANPSLIKFAAAPPTKANILKLIDIGQTLQRGGVVAADTEPTQILSNNTERSQYANGSELAKALKAQVDKFPMLSENSPSYVDDLKYDLNALDTLYKQSNLGSLVINKTKGTETFIPGYNAPLPKGLVNPDDEIEIRNNVQKVNGNKPGVFDEIDIAIETLRKEIDIAKSEAKTPPKAKLPDSDIETVKVGKQEINTLLDEVPREYGINPKWVKAMAYVESRFNPQAVSPKGAQGLLQLMPATAKALNVKNSFDPRQNIEGASKLLVELSDTFGKYKDKRIMFAAYNSTPSRVNAAISKARKAGDSITWENIAKYMPTETQNYVRDVTNLIEA